MTNKFLLLAALAVLAACNTVEGIGKDVSAAGQSIEKAAEDN
jgi:Predicted small secreted protein